MGERYLKRDFSPGFRQDMDINNELFVNFLRSALHHLYDPDQLRRSPLVHVFGLAERMDAPAELQKILLDAIEALKPAQEEGQHARSWLVYEVLLFRYVRGYERQAVANQLGISERQLSRDQRAALETLGQYLWKTYHLEDHHLDLAQAPPNRKETDILPVSPTEAEQSPFSWIEKLPEDKPSAWKLTLLSVLDLLRPLAQQNTVQIDYEPDNELTDLLVPQAALRHALLNILGVMIPLAQHARLALTPSVTAQTLSIEIRGAQAHSGITSFAEHPSIHVARRLVERAAGSLRLTAEDGPVQITIRLPALALIPVLVVDDNPDTIQLFQRYAQGTPYAVTGASSPSAFYQLVEKVHPRIILLDVMMPEIDGWDLLSQIRQEHRAQDAAIIICSILPQESLARFLGADSFLQKPVLPQDFLAALDQQIERFSRETGEST